MQPAHDLHMIGHMIETSSKVHMIVCSGSRLWRHLAPPYSSSSEKTSRAQTVMAQSRTREFYHSFGNQSQTVTFSSALRKKIFLYFSLRLTLSIYPKKFRKTHFIQKLQQFVQRTHENHVLFYVSST